MPKRSLGHSRAISYGEQRATTATDGHRSLRLSSPDGCTPYTSQAGHAGSIPVARSQPVSLANPQADTVLACDFPSAGSLVRRGPGIGARVQCTRQCAKELAAAPAHYGFPSSRR